MDLQISAAYPDYFWQFCRLLRDPVYRDPLPNRQDDQLGAGQPILLIPGFLAGDWTLRMMAGWLNRLGYRAYFSGIDWNIDCPNRTGELLRWRVDHIVKETGQAIIVIGHSLGGMLARFLGASFPGKVTRVISIGSPIHQPVAVNPLVLFASHVLYPLRQARGKLPSECGSLECPCEFQQMVFSALPSHIEVTSIFSKEDEVVDWHSSLDPDAQNLEVSGRHLGLIVNRSVFQALLEVLASPAAGNADNGDGQGFGKMHKKRDTNPGMANKSV